jgi:hypothetical protein
MKNVIIIDVDTEREQQLQIGKPSDTQPPTTPDEAKAIILTDISCVAETLNLMINIAHDSGYAKREDLVATAINHLKEMLSKSV